MKIKLLIWFMAAAIVTPFYSAVTKAETMTKGSVGLHEQNTMSVLWFQKAGEVKALYHQGYNIGKIRLEEALKKKRKKKPAIVLDIDETILDNSPYQAWNVLTGEGDPVDWGLWFKRAEAKPLPGAIDFLKYANSLGVAIYYITNRPEIVKDATIKNLLAVGAPQANEEHVLLMQPNEKSKEKRRMMVAKNHDIVLLFGDNLGDFSGFDELSVSGRIQAVKRHREEFGKKLIVFPNPMYGDWEAAIYHYDYGKTEAEKSKLRKDSLVPYTP